MPALGCAAPSQKPNAEQAQIYYELAAGYYRNRRVEAAMEEIASALKADPENPESYNLLGIIALNQGHDYVMQAESVSCLQGKDAAAVRADALQKFRLAERHFRKAVTFRPDFSSAWNNLSVAAIQLRDWDLAVSAAQSALKDVTYAQPETARANLGWAYFHKKEIHNAWKELHESVARAPGFCVGRYRLAKVYLERSDLERAAEEVEAVTGNKQCPIQEALLLAGLVYERKRDSERSRGFFQRCVELAPRSCVADECRGYLQLVQ